MAFVVVFFSIPFMYKDRVSLFLFILKLKWNEINEISSSNKIETKPKKKNKNEVENVKNFSNEKCQRLVVTAYYKTRSFLKIYNITVKKKIEKKTNETINKRQNEMKEKRKTEFIAIFCIHFV